MIVESIPDKSLGGKTKNDLTLLLSLCTERQVTKHPAQHLVPLWDALAEDWLEDGHPNGHLRDRFTLCCDLETRNTYALYWSPGFFTSGTVFLGGAVEVSTAGFVPAEDYEQQLHVAGYVWSEDGTTELVSTENDGCNEAWCDVDDWLYGPLFFWNLNPDGTTEAEAQGVELSEEEVAQVLAGLKEAAEARGVRENYLENCLEQ